MCAMHVVVLAGSHWSQLPPLNIWWRPVPAVVEILDERERQVADVGAERRHDGGAVGLVPDRPAAGQRHRVRIAEPAHAAHHAEVVIKRPVLLHQHHDVLDVLAAARRTVRRDGERASDAVGQHRRRDAPARELKEPTPTDVPHHHHLPHVHGQRTVALSCVDEPRTDSARSARAHSRSVGRRRPHRVLSPAISRRRRARSSLRPRARQSRSARSSRPRHATGRRSPSPRSPPRRAPLSDRSP